MFTCLVLV